MTEKCTMKRLILGAALALAMTAGAARADETTDDVHCLVVFMQMSNAKEQAARTGGLIGSFYYLGKLDQRSRGLDLESLIVTEVAKSTEASFKADAARCGADMTKRGQDAADLGKALQQHAQQMEKPGAKPAPPPASSSAPAQNPAEKPQ
jgi:hypothetical protein